MESYETILPGVQNEKKHWTFKNTRWHIDWCYLRHPEPENYTLTAHSAILRGTSLTLDDAASPTFLGLRQRDMEGELTVSLEAHGGEAGITAYYCEQAHYDLGIRKTGQGQEAFLRLRLGDIGHIQKTVPLKFPTAQLCIGFDALNYHFRIQADGEEIFLGTAQTRFLSSEVMTGFTGTVLALYATGESEGRFTDFDCRYH